jgi:hypothetical protein
VSVRRPLRGVALALAVLLAMPPAMTHAQTGTGAVGDPVQVTPSQARQYRQGSDPRGGMPMRARIGPAPARIGQALTYRGMVLVEHDVKVKFEPPQSGGSLTWSKPRAGREQRGWVRNVSAGYDSVWFEARLQVFETGLVPVPGPVIQLSRLPGTTHGGVTRLPVVRISILPTITAADSNAELRGLHGPLPAPWWERVPWLPIFVLLLLVLAFVVIRRLLKRRKPRPAVAPAVASAPARPRLDAGAEALRALAALRARELPGQGRFGEHALELTAILRRFLEATVTTPRPGDTSGELLDRLRSSRVSADDYERLEGLLQLWDRVKFARAPLTVEEAARCEEAVESYVRRVQQARLEAAQAAARAAAARAAAQSGGAGAPRGPQPPAPPPGAPEAA